MMNKKIGIVSSAVNCIAIIFFAVSMLFYCNFGSYFASLFIALSFVPMMCSYASDADKENKSAGYISIAFASIYATIVALVYFAQLTTVRLNILTPQAIDLLDFQQCGLMFNYDLLGYGLMSLATFFAGLTIMPQTKTDKLLKNLLMIHGLFFVTCLIMPMLGIFKSGSPAWIGVVILEFWCIYFSVVSILSFIHFVRNKSVTDSPTIR